MKRAKKGVTYYLTGYETPITREQLSTFTTADIFLVGRSGKVGSVIPLNEYIRSEVEKYDYGCVYMYKPQLEEFLFEE